MIMSPTRGEGKYMCKLDLQCSNNQVECHVLILGLRLLLELDVKVIKIVGDAAPASISDHTSNKVMRKVSFP